MSELSSAIRAVCEEKGLEFESVLETIELSLAAAYRKDFGEKNQNIKVDFDPETGETKIRDVKMVVEDLPEEEEIEEGVEKNEEKKKDSKKEGEEDVEEKKFNPKTEIQLEDAKQIKKSVKVGDELVVRLEAPEGYGRMAAQTAKQVIIQKLREAERDTIYREFKEKENEVVNGIVQRREGRNVLVDLGKAIGFLVSEEQIYGERYNSGERIKVYIKEVNMESRGPRIILSRASKEIVKIMFYLEIPEISSGAIELKGIARNAGSRSKVSVWTDSENIDPIGSCVGQKGARIQTIISELGGEKIDIIQYDEDPAKYIVNALSPAKIISIELDEKNKTAELKIASDQFSLAIGRRGENIRLASRLTGWKINITEDKEDSPEEQQEISSDNYIKEEEKDGSQTEETKKEEKFEKDDKKEEKKKDKKEEKKNSSKDSKEEKKEEKKIK
ncbi:transcription termination factor NusA [bacterium]|nr:transcription termination factor NusA [bacterium]